MSSAAARRPPWTGVAFVVIMVELLAWNVHVVYRNRDEYAPQITQRVVPRDIANVASRNLHTPVRDWFSFYYRLRAVRGATLKWPVRLSSHKFMLERVSRVHVELSEEPTMLETDAVERLLGQGNGYFLLDRTMGVTLIAEPGAKSYVVAEALDRNQLIIVTEPTLRAALDPR